MTVTDPFAERSGAHDYRDLGSRADVLTFETAPLESDLEVVGALGAEIYLAADAPDVDLWVKVLGASETSSSRMRPARITIHHDSRHPSRLILPVIPSEARDRSRPERENGHPEASAACPEERERRREGSSSSR